MNDGNFRILIGVGIAITVGVGYCANALHMPDSVACDALSVQGFTDCKVKDRTVVLPGWAGCGDDGIAFEASATNPAGRHVNLLVCCGVVLKGCTIRSTR